MGGSAGYYVRFKDLPEEDGGPVRKYVPILQFDSQGEALQAAIEYRNRKADELGLPREPKWLPHPEEAKEKMSASHNRLGLRGLGLSFTWRNGTGYPALRASGAHTLQEHVHPSLSEEEISRRGARGTARRLLQIKEDADPESQERKRIESLLERWESENPTDRELLEELLGT